MAGAESTASSTVRHVTFDLANGQVRSSGEERVILVPPAALDDLASSVGVEAASGFARAIGTLIGRRVARTLGPVDGVLGASLEAFVSELAFEVALSGWGSLRIERWGRAMVVAVENIPVAEIRLVAVVVEGAIEAAAGKAVHGVGLGPSREGVARILVASEKTAARARGWMAEGASGEDVLSRLQTPGFERSQA